jgi:hypothetical protein
MESNKLPLIKTSVERTATTTKSIFESSWLVRGGGAACMYLVRLLAEEPRRSSFAF